MKRRLLYILLPVLVVLALVIASSCKGGPSEPAAPEEPTESATPAAASDAESLDTEE